MHNAPSVSYPVGRCALEAKALAWLSAVTGGVLLWGWWDSHPQVPAASPWLPGWVGLGLWSVWTLAAAWHWWRQPAGVLKWDAQATPVQLDGPPGGWLWRTQMAGEGVKPVAVAPVQVLDGQGWVLLRLCMTGRMARWVWLERKGDPARWDDVRRALTRTR